ncbi:hypothetical protein [Sandarakinorhabdus sp.]|uniref:hypothetical protein n=1 Tax=Sandarakinorhabdus sp. TaxID=1916663 RepID=UPI00286DFA20|nr:hypothetical protein [Sandarakinorhabdus sp.]
MSSFRKFPGYVLAIALCGVGFLLMGLAWTGWTLGLSWQWGLVAIVLSMVARFNGFVLVGTFFFAQEYLHWPMLQCLALTAVGLLFLTPRVFGEVMGALTGKDIRPL